MRLYTCGPTVHDYAHIGNFRTYLWEDLLRRHLEYRGYTVRQVMNITDVEDKIDRQIDAEAGVTLDAGDAAPYTEAFFEDRRHAANIERAEHYPRATEHIPEMIELAQALRERGADLREPGARSTSSIDAFPIPTAGCRNLDNRERSSGQPASTATSTRRRTPATSCCGRGAATASRDWDSPFGRVARAGTSSARR